MPITVKKGGLYLAPAAIFVKNSGIYAGQTTFVKIGGVYQSASGAVPSYGGGNFTYQRASNGAAIFA